jgi:YVTN family beta-propeller protein
VVTAALVSGACGCCGSVQEISSTSFSQLWNEPNQNSGAVAVSPDGKAVFISNEGGSCGTDGIGKYDVATHAALKTVTGSPWCIYGLAVTPDGSSVYAANACSGNVMMLDSNTLSTAQTINGLPGASDVAIFH